MARPKKPIEKFTDSKQALTTVENAANLFTHEGTGICYGRTRRGGKDLIKCLETKNRREADAALQDWFKDIASPQVAAGSFHELLDELLTLRLLLAKKTQENDKYVVELFKKHYPAGVDIPKSRVPAAGQISWVTAWAGTKEKPKIKAATYNRYRSSVKQIFQIAADNGIYPEDRNPFRANSISKRKTDEIIRLCSVLNPAIVRVKDKSPDTRIFQIQDAKKALGAACKALNLPISRSAIYGRCS